MALPKAKEMVQSNSVVVFSKTYCPFCVTVKKLLDDVGATYKTIELDTESNFLSLLCFLHDFKFQHGDGSEIQAALAEWTGQRTVPNVFIGGKHIGGCDATTGIHKEGKLLPLLTESGAIASKS